MADTIEYAAQDRQAKAVSGPPRRILMLSTSCPFPPTNGYTMRVWALLKCLAAEGCETNVVCFGNTDNVKSDTDEARQVCRNVDIIPHQEMSLTGRLNIGSRLAALLSRYPYSVSRSRSSEMAARIAVRLTEVDAIFCEETNLLINLPSRLSVPLIVDHHNVEYLLLRRYARHAGNPLRAGYAWLEARKTREWEKNACSRADMVLACSDHDRSLFSRLHPGVPVATAPNVVDVATYVPRDEDDGCTVLYAGGMDWHPNRDAVEFFVDRILPEVCQRVPRVRFVVAGRSPSEDFRKRFIGFPQVEFTGTVPDMRAEIAKATICVVPLRIGSGTRLKILEAAAMGKAIISTRIGAEGLEFIDGEEILLADSADAFAAATIRLLSESDLRSRIGHAARTSVQKQYDYVALRASLRDVWARLMLQRHRLLTGDDS